MGMLEVNRRALRRQWPWLVMYWCGIVMLGACVMALGGMLAQ